MDVVVLCGLPASGKTTAAGRLHARLGGALIRSCDVYRDLGIDLPAWVRKTDGFTRDAGAYERLRDHAYVEMAARLEARLQAGAGPVILDAVHGERAKRMVIYERARARGVAVTLVWCRSDNEVEIARRIAARRGRPEPEHEAADRSVVRHLTALWDDPAADPPVRAGTMPVVLHDSVADRCHHVAGPATAIAGLIVATLAARVPAEA